MVAVPLVNFFPADVRISTFAGRFTSFRPQRRK
jgi:hypothetical protein